MKPKFKSAERVVRQVVLGTILTFGFVLACTMLSVMI